MKRETLGYPDNLWRRVVDRGTYPVPEDAAETLELVFQKVDLRDEDREIIDLRFKQGKSTAEIGKLFGLNRTQVDYRISRAIRAFFRPGVFERNGATLEYGLAANERRVEENELIAEGKADRCCVCGKLIWPSDPCFLMPHEELSGSFVYRCGKLAPILCCSEECATAGIENNIRRHSRSIKYLQERLQKTVQQMQEEVRSHEETIQRFKKHRPVQMSYQEAHVLIKESGYEDEQEA